MPERKPPNRIYRFGEYKLLADERMLMRGNYRVHMTPRVFHLLLILVENAGKLVTKETLLNDIWQDSFVEEGNLNSTVSRLRKILGEKPDEKRFIETIPRVGYRFIAEVEQVTEGERQAEPITPTIDEVKKTEEPKRSRRWLII